MVQLESVGALGSQTSVLIRPIFSEPILNSELVSQIFTVLEAREILGSQSLKRLAHICLTIFEPKGTIFFFFLQYSKHVVSLVGSLANVKRH